MSLFEGDKTPKDSIKKLLELIEVTKINTPKSVALLDTKDRTEIKVPILLTIAQRNKPAQACL